MKLFNFLSIIVLIFVLMFVGVGEVKARTIWIFDWTSVKDECSGKRGVCSIGNNCPTCSSTTNSCCNRGLGRWAKYNMTCDSNPILGGYSMTLTAKVSSEQICSTGDKCLRGEIGLRAGNCKCDYGGLYKICCSTSPGVGPVECQQINNDDIYPYEGKCPSGSTTISIPQWARLGGGQVDQSWLDSVCASCYPSNGSAGVCGASNGGVSATPPSNLCTVGTASWTDQTANDGIYNWNCLGTAGYCNGSNGANVACSALKDSLPTRSSFVIKTYDGDTVAVETGNRNQMCQTLFRQDTVNKNGVQFVVTATDTQGLADIGSIQVRLRGTSTYTFTAVPTNGTGTATISVDFSTITVLPGIYNIDVLINDVHAAGSWSDTGRDFKYWNCQVPVSGTIYDGSGGGRSCETSFGTVLASNVDFISLFFKQSGGSEGVDNNVSGATYSSKVGSYFIWGDDVTYSAQFNSDLKADVNTMDLKLNTGASACTQEIGSFKVEPVVDPYVTAPSLVANFLAIVDQDPWFQTINGGVFSKSTITDYVPVTCALSVGCTSAISIGGLVVAPTINSTVGVPYSTPNNWYVKSSAINKINFFEKYKKISGVGITTIEGNLTDNNIINNTNGLLMVNGNVTISQDKETPEGNFLMIVASGDITIEESVTQFDGVLVGNNINVVGTSDEKLTINGSLYGTTRVNIIRNYADKEANNTSPAVVIKFRPDFIFNMPSSMAKNVIEWKWGN